MSEDQDRDKEIEFEQEGDRIELLRVDEMGGATIYTRNVKLNGPEVMYEYFVVFDSEIYSSYLIIEYEGDQEELTANEKAEAENAVYAGAHMTVKELKKAKAKEKRVIT